MTATTAITRDPGDLQDTRMRRRRARLQVVEEE